MPENGYPHFIQTSINIKGSFKNQDQGLYPDFI